MIEIYVDGGNSLKNRIGGCAAIVTKDNVIIAELSEAYSGDNVTNNTMELGGMILACRFMLDHPELGKDVTIISDSEYVVLGARDRLDRWISRGWKNTGGQVKNRVLWEAIAWLKTQLNITWKWTKGHESNRLNNLADSLAVEAYKQLRKE